MDSTETRMEDLFTTLKACFHHCLSGPLEWVNYLPGSILSLMFPFLGVEGRIICKYGTDSLSSLGYLTLRHKLGFMHAAYLHDLKIYIQKYISAYQF